MVQLSERHLLLQTIPIGQPDDVPRRLWAKAKAHGRADARGLTANEVSKRVQQRQARQEADEARVAERNFMQQLQHAAADDTQLSTITVAPWRQQRPTTPTASSQSSLTSVLPIRSPATPGRPRPRRTPTPEGSPLPVSTFELPASTAPPKLGGEKRKRPHTRKYQESRAAGIIAESQEAHKAELQG